MKTGSTKKKSETYCRFCEAKTWKKKISCGKYILSKQLFFHYKNTRKSCEICSKLMIKTERRRWRCPEVFIVNFEPQFTLFASVSIANFEKVNVCWLSIYWMITRVYEPLPMCSIQFLQGSISTKGNQLFLSIACTFVSDFTK